MGSAKTDSEAAVEVSPSGPEGNDLAATVTAEVSRIRDEMRELYDTITQSNLKVNTMLQQLDQAREFAKAARDEAKLAKERAEEVERSARQLRAARCAATVTASHGVVALVELHGKAHESEVAFWAPRGARLVLVGEPYRANHVRREVWQQGIYVDPETQKNFAGWVPLRVAGKRLVSEFVAVG